MDRRTFIGALTAGAVLTTSRAATAQQTGGVRHVGILTAGVLPRTVPPAFVNDLRELGWVESQNLVFDRRGGDGNSERVPALAAELVQMKLDVIVSFGAVAGVALRNATTTIPIVAMTGDPVRLGLVSNLSRPGGNITGLSLIAPELAAKRLELIRELLPKATLIGELVDPANTYWQRVRPEYEQRSARSVCNRSLSKWRTLATSRRRSPRLLADEPMRWSSAAIRCCSRVENRSAAWRCSTRCRRWQRTDGFPKRGR